MPHTLFRLMLQLYVCSDQEGGDLKSPTQDSINYEIFHSEDQFKVRSLRRLRYELAVAQNKRSEKFHKNFSMMTKERKKAWLTHQVSAQTIICKQTVLITAYLAVSSHFWAGISTNVLAKKYVFLFSDIKIWLSNWLRIWINLCVCMCLLYIFAHA